MARTSPSARRRSRIPRFSMPSSGAARGSRTPIATTCRRSRGLEQVEGPQSGDRAPDADLGGGKALYDFTRHPSSRCSCSRRTTTTRAHAASTLRQLTQRFHAVLAAHVVPPSPDVARHYGAIDARPVLPVAPGRLRRLQVPRHGGGQARGASRPVVHHSLSLECRGPPPSSAGPICGCSAASCQAGTAPRACFIVRTLNRNARR